MTSVLLRQCFQMLDLLDFGFYGMDFDYTIPYLGLFRVTLPFYTPKEDRFGKRYTQPWWPLLTHWIPPGWNLHADPTLLGLGLQRWVLLQIPEVNLRTGGSSKCIPGIRSGLSINPGDIPLPSGKPTKSYWTMAIEIVSFPIKDGDFP